MSLCPSFCCRGTETGVNDCVFHCGCSFGRGVRLNLIFCGAFVLNPALIASPRRRREMSTGHTFPPLRESSCRWRFFAREKYNRLPVDQNTRRRNNLTRRLSTSKNFMACRSYYKLSSIFLSLIRMYEKERRKILYYVILSVRC